jgi:hypothetical protein
MLELTNIELTRDKSAARFVKHEGVDVVFALTAGELISREGPNRFDAGDALITGSTGDRWSVSRSRFDARYAPVGAVIHGEDGRYQARPVPVLAKQMTEAFSLARSRRWRHAARERRRTGCCNTARATTVSSRTPGFRPSTDGSKPARRPSVPA